MVQHYVPATRVFYVDEDVLVYDLGSWFPAKVSEVANTNKGPIVTVQIYSTADSENLTGDAEILTLTGHCSNGKILHADETPPLGDTQYRYHRLPPDLEKYCSSSDSLPF